MSELIKKYKDCVKFIDGKPVALEASDMYRIERKTLLEKFDIYKTNVSYGLITETEERHEVIAKWYNDMLNITETLDETLITNHPEELDNY